MEPALIASLDRILTVALAEDLGSSDVTTDALVPEGTRASAFIRAKEHVVVCGLSAWKHTLTRCEGSPINFSAVPDGSAQTPGTILAEVEADAAVLLSTERIVMNLVCHLTGIATVASAHTAVAGGLRILDTRKTTPGLRALEKYAVRTGGAHNHRFGLDAGILIKENHIAVAGSITNAITKARKHAPHSLKIQCEVCTPAEALEAVAAGADALLLDNMNDETIAAIAAQVGQSVFLEASGNMNTHRIERLSPLAADGLDAVSVGALIHSRPYSDLSMILEVQS
ncbi:MAG: nicotinate-nucleotide diphosphorylase (carboxylating) [Myxococcales bacterium]|nr:nicotinate-nucleotide diphosphorylase (carboxylating) [Myxococcales bacterium]|tara:strand:- start:2720 stop:3571 length:852 start_codon:yes stop_codon:yes gene_type:complete